MDCSPKQLLSPCISENNSGLTQELQNLRISGNQDPATTLNNTEESKTIISGLNGDYKAKRLTKSKNKDSPFGSFAVPSLEFIENILLKISKCSSIEWVKSKFGYKCNVMAPKIGKFSLNFWSGKSTVNLEGKNARLAKREIVKMMKTYSATTTKQKETKPTDSSNHPWNGDDPANQKLWL